jgi:hypothetical protein
MRVFLVVLGLGRELLLLMLLLLLLFLFSSSVITVVDVVESVVFEMI